MALVASAVLTPHGPLTLHDPALYILALGVAVLGTGTLLLLDDRRPGRPTPRRFKYLQDRNRLWATANDARANDLNAAATVAPSVLTLGR